MSRERFYARLPDDVSRDVIYLKVDDHYVEVHTTGGSCLLLMNFGSAVADLGGLGMQVHRSYWIARGHVTATVRRDGRTMLRVTGGDLVPVSRTYLQAGARRSAHRRPRPEQPRDGRQQPGVGPPHAQPVVDQAQAATTRQFRRFTISSFHHSVVSSFHRSIVPPFHRSTVPPESVGVSQTLTSDWMTRGTDIKSDTERKL